MQHFRGLALFFEIDSFLLEGLAHEDAVLVGEFPDVFIEFGSFYVFLVANEKNMFLILTIGILAHVAEVVEAGLCHKLLHLTSTIMELVFISFVIFTYA